MKKFIIGMAVLLFVFSIVSGAAAATFTLDQLSNHGTVNDCYLVINGKVYDVTAFFGNHPGGDAYILNDCGKDATTDFATKGGNGVDHSQSAYALLKQFYVGDLTSSGNKTNTVDSVNPGNQVSSGNPAGSGTLLRYPLVTPIFIAWVILLIIFRLLAKKFPVKVNRGTAMKITSITMLVAFLGVASGGVYMALFGRFFINGMDAIVFHVYFGFIFVLGALTHIFIHLREIWIYISKIFKK